MWAQLIKSRVKPGREDDVRRLPQEFEARRQSGGPGPLKVTMMESQNDPGTYYTLVMFESEEKARENERRPDMAEWQQRVQSLYEGPPEYVDLNVIFDGPR